MLPVAPALDMSARLAHIGAGLTPPRVGPKNKMSSNDAGERAAAGKQAAQLEADRMQIQSTFGRLRREEVEREASLKQAKANGPCTAKAGSALRKEPRLSSKRQLKRENTLSEFEAQVALQQVEQMKQSGAPEVEIRNEMQRYIDAIGRVRTARAREEATEHSMSNGKSRRSIESDSACTDQLSKLGQSREGVRKKPASSLDELQHKLEVMERAKSGIRKAIENTRAERAFSLISRMKHWGRRYKSSSQSFSSMRGARTTLQAVNTLDTLSKTKKRKVDGAGKGAAARPVGSAPPHAWAAPAKQRAAHSYNEPLPEVEMTDVESFASDTSRRAG